MRAKKAITGILLLDKPSGFSSNAVLQKVKRLWGAEKAGHTGTLDPLACGMLPICFGEATKLIRFLLASSKQYQVKIALGHTMSTGDADGTLLQSRSIPQLSLEAIEKILETFRGPIEQIPPIYSAIKQNGKRLYELARQGRELEIEKKARSVRIYQLTLDQYEYVDDSTAYLTLTVHCSKGTYIRSLAHDLGEKIGCGAYVAQLRRTWVDPFQGQAMYTLSELENLESEEDLERVLLKSERAIPEIPKMDVSLEAYQALYQGKHIQAENEQVAPGWVQLWCEALNRFFGIGEVLGSGLIVPRRLFKSVSL